VSSVCSHRIDRAALLSELHRFEWSALAPALCETVRLLESGKFERLSDAHLNEIANYRAVELDDEVFFDRAFTPGKEAAASLAFARYLGIDTVLKDLRSLRASIGCDHGQVAA
jgi:hypothetical protein